MRVDNGVNSEGASIEEERAGMRVLQRDESRAVDGAGGEIEVESERDMGSGWMSGIGEGMRVNWCHFSDEFCENECICCLGVRDSTNAIYMLTSLKRTQQGKQES